MKYCDKGTSRYLIVVTALTLVLCCSFPLVSDAQERAAEKKDAPASQETGTPLVDTGADYDSCSPVFPGEQIAQMMAFAKALSTELPGKLRPILLKCDVELNNRLLEFIETLQLQVSALEFRNEQQELDFLAEKAKEIEIELVLTEKPIKEAELKKLVTELFDIVQKRLKTHAEDLDLEAMELKKRIQERESLKDRIVDKRIQHVKDRQKQGQLGQHGDRLSWD